VPDSFPHDARAFLESYCFECHGDGAAEGDVDLQILLERPADRVTRDTWRRVMQQLELRIMPPPETATTPDESTSADFVEKIDQRFFRVDCENVRDPGRVTTRRLNRVEYENTIHDLLGVTFHASELFPRDDVGYGFDNIGDVLTLSPLLLEKYLSAAEKISQEVISTEPRANLRVMLFSAAELQATLPAGATIEDDYLILNRGGSAYASFYPYVPGEYVLQVRGFGFQAGDELVRMAIKVAGETVSEFEFQQDRQPALHEIRLTFGDNGHPLGQQEIHFAYVNDYFDAVEGDRDMAILEARLEGPSHLAGETFPYPPTHRRVIRVEPDDQHSVDEAVRANLTHLARRAFRHPVGDEDIEPFVRIVNLALGRGETFQQEMQFGLQAILVSPKFLFRVESPSHPDDGQHVEAIGQFELASRLSYFLCSTMPDEELFRLAEEGELARPDVLQAQVERLLDSPNSMALVENFAGQWLNLRNLADVRPNKQAFPEFDESLAKDMQQETLLLMENILRRDQSLLTLLSADYTFVNERLAGHYGLSGVEGEEFRQVSLTDVPRRGVLTQASILTLTSDPARTLPVKRGKWILETILGSAPPPPPPNIPTLAATAEANPGSSTREQLTRHRQDAACSGCHQVMDPLGLAFEHYDAIGRWRDTVDEQPVDAAGAFPDGGEFEDAMELIELLREREIEYAQQVTRAMLTYAVGRGLEPYDQCAVDQIVATLKQNGYRFRTLVREIVLSDPFQMRRGDGGQP